MFTRTVCRVPREDEWGRPALHLPGARESHAWPAGPPNPGSPGRPRRSWPLLPTRSAREMRTKPDPARAGFSRRTQGTAARRGGRVERARDRILARVGSAGPSRP